ncbi:EAL domain-containing protein [Nakamurella silvestris]|nr:EAL domain-containing protein [Nakamurella silvestris]
MVGNRAPSPTARSSWTTLPQWVLTGLALAMIGLLVLQPGDGTVVGTVTNLAQLLFAAVATGAAFLASRRSTGRRRAAWSALALGAASWTTGQLIWCWYELVIDERSPFPSAADVFFLLFPVGAAAGLWLFPFREVAGDRLRRLLDALVVVSALVSISWPITLDLAVNTAGDDTLAVVVALAYPISDILIVTMAVLSLSRSRDHRRPLVLLALAMASMAVADGGFAHYSALGTYRSGGILDAGWLVGFLLLAFAAHGASRSRSSSEEAGPITDRPTSPSMLPYVPLVIAFAALGGRYIGGGRPGRVEVVSIGLAVAIVLVRQYMTLLDNRRLLDTVAARESQLERQAFHDQLTGLANRALFTDRVAHALELHRRDRRPLALMFCDLDDFKAVNDTLGHAAGDALLIRVGERLRGAVRSGDTLARFGGDEFAILIEDGGESAAVGGRIIESLRAPFVLGGTELLMRASIGVIGVAADDPSPPLEALLAKADIAMYTAKRGGKGRLALYESSMTLPAELREPLARAVENDAIEVAYQPVFRLADGAIVELEALARWEFDGSSISPADFIPLAIRTGLITRLTDQVLERVCADLVRWSKTLGHSRLRVAVNVPPDLVVDPAFPDRVAAALAKHGLAGSQLKFEITEDALSANLPLARAVTTRLHELGGLISLEDFGTGTSSLLHLQQIPFHSVKIDMTFIAEVESDTGVERFLRALLTLGHDLGLEVTAEGVERAAQAQLLRSFGYRYAQGYHFARPMPAAGITGLLVPDQEDGGDVARLAV